MIWYGGRLFRPVSINGASDTNSETIFKYSQKDEVVTAEYSGGNIRYGHLVGLVDAAGHLNMRYHHITQDGSLMAGTCQTRPEIIDGGKLRLIETWQWNSGDKSSGTSVLEEV